MAKKNEIIITRMINSPRELVFKAWVDPSDITHWWGHHGSTNTIKKMEVISGGICEFIIHESNGVDYPTKIIYQEVIRLEKLVYKQYVDSENNMNQFEAIVTFIDYREKTELTICMIFASVEERYKIGKEYRLEAGTQQAFSRLEYYLIRMHSPQLPDEEFSSTQTINAPRELVFKLWTDPNHFLNWWAKDSEIKVNKLDIQPEGIFHYGFETSYGETKWTKLVYQKMEKPTYLSFTSSPSDEKGRISDDFTKRSWPLEVLDEITFLEENGKTVLHMKSKPINATPAERKLFKDTHQAMETSFKLSCDRLIEYINSII